MRCPKANFQRLFSCAGKTRLLIIFSGFRHSICISYFDLWCATYYQQNPTHQTESKRSEQTWLTRKMVLIRHGTGSTRGNGSLQNGGSCDLGVYSPQKLRWFLRSITQRGLVLTSLKIDCFVDFTNDLSVHLADEAVEDADALSVRSPRACNLLTLR